MKKVLFGITSLTLGGAERVLVDLANKLCEKYEITIFTIYSNGELEKQLNKKIKLISIYNIRYDELSKIQKLLVPLKILLNKKGIYKKEIKGKYNVEISFLEGPITRLFSVKNEEVRKIAWIHNDISLVFGQGIKSKIKQLVDGKIYSKFESLIFVSKENLENFNTTYPKLKNIKKEVIYNYIDKENVIQKSNEIPSTKFESNTINFVTVARLVEQKAIDRFIEVHSELIKNGLNHTVYVIGDGPEKEKLKNIIQKENVEKTFHLLGKMENPYPYIKNADYFTLLSNFEGYGMVLEEAKILGKPIIITNTAAREAVLGYTKSYILKNTKEGIYSGLEDIIKKHKKSENIYDNINYDNSEIIKKVEKLVGE